MSLRRPHSHPPPSHPSSQSVGTVRRNTVQIIDEVQSKLEAIKRFYTNPNGALSNTNSLFELNDEMHLTNEYLTYHLQHLPALRTQRPRTYVSHTPNQLGVEVITTITTTSSNDLPESLMGLVRDLIGSAPIGDFNIIDGLQLHEDVVVGLDKETIRKMKTYRFNPERRRISTNLEEPERCCICYKDYKDNTKIRRLPCKHEFHKKCIDTWFEAHTKCPVCRMDVRDVLRN